MLRVCRDAWHDASPSRWWPGSRSPRAPPRAGRSRRRPRASRASPCSRSRSTARGRSATSSSSLADLLDDAPRGERSGARARGRRGARERGRPRRRAHRGDGAAHRARRSAPTRSWPGSLTELAGRYSLDVQAWSRPTRPRRTRTLVFTAEGEHELLDRVNELADRVLEVAGGAPRPGPDRRGPDRGRAPSELGAELPKRLRLQRGGHVRERRRPRGPRARCARCRASRPPTSRRSAVRAGVVVIYRARPDRAADPGEPRSRSPATRSRRCRCAATGASRRTRSRRASRPSRASRFNPAPVAVGRARDLRASASSATSAC